MKAIELNVTGIQCDAPGCGFVDETAKLEDWEGWLGRPCPRCGANLLTEADLAGARGLVGLAEWVNELVGPVEEGTPTVGYEVKFDGSGGVEIVEGRCAPK